MTSLIEIILLFSIASPMIQSNNIIFDDYQFDGSSSISQRKIYAQQELFSKIEKSLVLFINITFNAQQCGRPGSSRARA